MPQHAKNPEHRWYFYPLPPPEDVLEWENWTQYQVCIPGPLISYLLNVMRIYQWEGRVRTDDPTKAAAFVQAWNDLVARVGASVESAECVAVPYPIFRQNPSNPRQMQQSIDNGATWTTVLDMGFYPILRAHPSITGAMQQSIDNGATWTTVLDPISIPAFPTIPPMIQLRQNPSQPEILQQSLNSGSSWTTAFDYSLYEAVTSITYNYNTYNETEQTFTEVENQYHTDGDTIINIAPDIIYGGSHPAAELDKVICAALSFFVQASMSTLTDIKRAEHQAYYDPSTRVGAIMAGVGTGAGAVAGLGLYPPALGAVGVVTALIGVGFVIQGAIVQPDLSVFQDSAAIEDVYCCLVNALKGATPTQSAFAAAAGSCDLPGNAGILAGLFSSLMADLDVYLQFALYAQQMFEASQVVELPECPCEPTEPVLIFNPDGRPGGSFVKSGMTYTFTSDTNDAFHRIAFMWNMPGTCVKLVSISYSVTPTGGAGNWKYNCGTNPADNFMTGYVVGLPAAGANHAGLLLRNSTGPFTATITFEEV